MSKQEKNRFDVLQKALQEQLALVQKGDLRAAEKRKEKIEQMLSEILSQVTPEASENSQDVSDLLKCYKEIEFVLQSQKNILDRQLRKIAGGKKAVQAYNI